MYKVRADCGQFWKETNHLNFQFHLFSQTGKDCEKKEKKKKGGRRGHIPSHELISVSVRVLPNSSFLHTPQTSCQTGVKFQIVNQRDFFRDKIQNTTYPRAAVIPMQETIHSPSVRTEGRKSETGCYHVMNCGSANERVPGQQSVPAECGPAPSKENPGEEHRTKSSVVFCCCRHYLVRNRWH